MPVFARKKQEYQELSAANRKLKAENRILQDSLDGIIALYDITEEICKYLDVDKIFACFKEELNKYIKVDDCKLLKGNAGLADYKGYVLFPLKIQDELIGHLAVDGLKQQDKERFYILSQQLLLGIKRAILYEGVQSLSIIDTLTNVFNRRYYLERFKEELERSIKFKHVFSCLMIDIDYFKTFNDRYGHIVGDAILIELSKTIQENIRQIDMLGRYGGEEFLIVLCGTPLAAAKKVIDRMCSSIAKTPFVLEGGDTVNITLSAGISERVEGDSIESLIQRADGALYRAKSSGRNRVVVK